MASSVLYRLTVKINFFYQNFLSRHFLGKIEIAFTKVSFACARLISAGDFSFSNAPLIFDKFSDTLIPKFLADTFLAILKIEN